MVRFTPCTCDLIHGPIYTLYLWSNPSSHLHVSVVGSNSWSFFLCLLWGQNHGSIYTLYLCLLWGQIHAPIYTLSCVCLGSNLRSHLHPVLLSVVESNPWSDLLPVLVIKSMVPFTPCTCDQIHGPIDTLYMWSNSWSHLHTVVVSVVGSNPWTHLHPVLCLFRVKSKVPFTPCTFVCCGVKSMVRFTPCTGDQIHGPIYTLYLWSNPWSHWHPVYVIKFLVPFTHCSCVCCEIKFMVPFNPVRASVVGSNSLSHLHPVLESV